MTGGLLATCPGCGLQAKLPETAAGRTVKCPRCNTRFAPGAPAPGVTVPEAAPVPGSTRPEVRVPTATVAEPEAIVESDSAPSVTARPRTEWEPGDLVLDLYRVTGILGQGGMGRVYRVRHLGWDLDLAVKAPLPDVLEALGGPELFEKEAETWVNLGLHPHVVSCYYVRRVAGLPVVFAEFVDGGSLHDAIRSRRLRTTDALLDAAIQFAWGLHYAHELGLVHRDVKPANVMTTADGLVKVTDFGLARSRGGALPAGAGGGQTLVVKGGVAGTPAYMPPEQSAGAALSRRADLWSWALSVLEMFQGGRTWEYGAVAREALEDYVARGGRVVGMPPMPASVVDLLRRCFRESPDERPHSLWEAATVLYAAYEEAARTPYPRAEPQAGRATGDSLTNRAVSLLDLGRDAEAPALWDAALRAEPHHLEASYDQSLHAWSAGRLNDDELVARVQEAAATHHSPRAFQLQGRALLAMGDASRAAAALQQALDGGLASAEVERELALALCAQRSTDPAHWARAADLLGRARQSGHEDDVELCATALCLARMGEPEKARRHLEDTAARRPDVPADLGAALARHVPGQETVRVVRGLTHPASVLARGRHLVSLEGSELRVRDLETGASRLLQPAELLVRAVAALGRSILCGGEGAPLQLVDTETGRSLRSFPRHAGKVNAVAISGDGRIAVAGGSDRLLRVYDVGDGRCLHALEGHAEGISAVAVTPDGRVAAAGAIDGRVLLWETDTGRALPALEGGRGRVVGLVVTDADGLVLALHEDRLLRHWDVESGRLVRALAGPSQPVHAMALSPDERLAAVAGADRAVRLWDVARGRVHAVVRLEAAVTALAFESPDAVWAASAHELRLLRVPPRARLPPFAVARPVSAVEVEERDNAFQTQLAAVQETLRGGDLARALELARTLRAIPGYERAEPALALWDEIGAMLPRKALSAAWESSVLAGHQDPVLAVAVSADGGRVISAGMDHTVRLWDPGTREQLACLDGHTDTVTSVALLPDGRLAVSGGWDHTLRLWDLASGSAVRVLEGHQGYVSAVAVGPDGDLAVSGSWDETVGLWDLATGQRLHQMAGHGGQVTGVAFSPDGRWVASSGGDGTVRAWDTATGECASVLGGHEDAATAVAVSPNARQLVSGGADRTVRVWDLRGRRTLRTFSGHEAEVTSVAFTPDGRYVWSASRDKTLRLWNVGTGTCERVLAHTAALLALATHPAGNAVVGAGADRTVRVWHLDWEPDARPAAAWDEQARPFLETFVSLRLKPETVRTGTTGRWTDGDVDRLVSDLHHRGFGGVTRETVTSRLQDLAARDRQAEAYWDEVRRTAPARTAAATATKPARPWGRIAAGVGLVVSIALLAAVLWRSDPRLLPYMVERNRKTPPVIPLSEHAGDCSAGGETYWLDLATAAEVSAPTLACLASFRAPSTIDDFLDRAPLDDFDTSVRVRRQRSAVALLVALGDVGADRICARLDDPRPAVSGVATLALTTLLARGEAAAASCVTRSLDDTSTPPGRRRAAASLLRPLLASGHYGDATAWTMLDGYRADADPAVRALAVSATVMFDADSAGEVLEAAGKDPDPGVRAAAGAALSESRAGRLYDR